MTATIVRLLDMPVLICAPDGPKLDEGVALELIGEALSHQAEVVAIPVRRCPDEFFSLASGLAGAVLLKFANYHLRLAIVGDISERLARSNALRDFVSEANRGKQVWFVADQHELEERLQILSDRQGGGPTRVR